MTIKQISIFIENKPETLSELTDVLAKNNVNMRAIMLADTSDFGIVRLIVDNPDETAKLLEQNDYVIKANGVIAIQIPDEAGSLNSILKLLGQNGRNVEYMQFHTRQHIPVVHKGSSLLLCIVYIIATFCKHIDTA